MADTAPKSHPWMAVRDGLDGPATFGPFLPEPGDSDDGRKAAERFARRGGFVYDDRVNRASNCGPWLP